MTRRAPVAASAALLLAACGQGADTPAAGNRASGAPVASSASSPTPTAVADGATAPAQTACAAAEQTLFSCAAPGGKRIAVCGVTGPTGPKTAQYRYGGKTPEIVVDGGRFASVPYSGGGEAQIAFANGAVQYIVYSRTVRTNFAAGEPNDPEFTDGVMVVKGGETVSDKRCTGEADPPVDASAGEAYGGVATELFHYAD